MRTAVQSTSIANYHGHVVPVLENRQAENVMRYISLNGPSTIDEIAHALKMEKSTVSARKNKLREDGLLEFGIKRKSRISGVTCNTLRLLAVQLALFS